MGSDEQEEMTASAVARLAGVGRAAVSNWRRRYPHFPKPVGGSATSPTFSRAQVVAWLAATGKGDQLATAGRTDTGTQRIDGVVSGPEAALGSADRERAVIAQLLAGVMVSRLPRSTVTGQADEEGDVPAVLDPACFQATLLMAVADRFGDRVRLVGQEIRESDAALAALALRGHPHNVQYEIHTGDSLLDNRLGAYRGAAAAVVCEPPSDGRPWPSAQLATDARWEFGTPAPRDAELAWVQHCYAHLRPRGVAVVAVPARAGVQPAGQHVRAALVRSGALREVIALPRGMGSLPTSELCLWVLQRPTGPADHAPVRIVDLSALADPAEVPREFAAWQRLFDGADPTVCRAVSGLELLDAGTSLQPARHLATGVRVTADDLARVTDRLQALYARLGRGLPRFAAPARPPRHTVVTLGELERVGALTIRGRDTTPRADDVLLRTQGRPPVVATGTDADDAGVAQVVELDPDRLDPHFVATFLRADANALPVANTLGALNRDDLRRCRLPRLSLAEQRRYGDAFRRLHELRGALSALTAVSTHVIEQTIHGLTVGAVVPDPTPATPASDDETRRP